MTEELLEYLAAALKTNLSFLDEIQYLGRKSVDGYTLAGKNYIGISDKRGQYGYFRIQGENDHTYTRTESSITSKGSWYSVKAPLRLVLIVDPRDCGDIHSLESNAVQILNSVVFPPGNFGRVSLNVENSTTDFERIFQEETDSEEITFSDAWELLAIEFELTYLSNECCQISQPSGSCDPATATRENPETGEQEPYLSIPSGSNEELNAPTIHEEDESNPESGAYTLGWPIVLTYDTPGDALVIDDVSRDAGNTLISVQRPICNDDPVEILFDERGGTPASQGTVAPGGNYLVLSQDITDILGNVQELAYQGEEIRLEHDAADLSFDTATPGLVKITVAAGGAPSGIRYSIPQPALINDQSFYAGDTPAQFYAGRFDYTPPTNPISNARLDHLAEQQDIRATPASGTLATTKIGPTRLKENNRYGNKYRFTDDAGNPSSASAASDLWAHVNWRQHNWAGATPYYVRDHLTGFGLIVRGITNGLGKYNMDSAGNGLSWEDWLDYLAASYTIGTYTSRDFFLPYWGLGGAHESFFFKHTWTRNFFTNYAGSSRCYGATGCTAQDNSLSMQAFHDSDNDNYVSSEVVKATHSGFASRIMAILPIRIDRS